MKIDQQTELLDDQPAKKSKSSVPKILDGKYYAIICSTGTKVDAKCMTCLKVRKGDVRSTGNFMEHYRSAHPELKDAVEKYRKQKDEICATVPLKQPMLNFSTPTTFSKETVCSSLLKRYA